MAYDENDVPDQSGRVAVVTGANSGIGLETARVLANQGATVVMACRNAEKAEAAAKGIRDGYTAGSVEVSSLDLSSLESVADFSRRVSSEHDRLDLLINNAGVMVPPFGKTADGFELQFGTNHLGHFALTAQLIGLLTETDGARVVTVSSLVHKAGAIDFDNLNAEKGYNASRAYAQSKLANLLFTHELQRRLTAADYRTLAVAAHPGWTATNLQANVSLVRFLNPIFGMKPIGGALPTLRAATDPNAKPGAYYGPGGPFEVFGAAKPVESNRRSHDEALAAKLWTVSEELTKQRFDVGEPKAA